MCCNVIWMPYNIWALRVSLDFQSTKIRIVKLFIDIRAGTHLISVGEHSASVQLINCEWPSSLSDGPLLYIAPHATKCSNTNTARAAPLMYIWVLRTRARFNKINRVDCDYWISNCGRPISAFGSGVIFVRLRALIRINEEIRTTWIVQTWTPQRRVVWVNR